MMSRMEPEATTQTDSTSAPPVRLLILTLLNDRSETAIWRQLAADGFVITHAGAAGAPEQHSLQEAGIETHDLVVKHRLDIRGIKRVRALVRRSNPHLIYAPRNACLSAALWAEKRIPIVGYRGTTGHLSRLDPASWMTYLHPRLAHIICVSEAVRTYLLRMGVAPERLTTIYKGHDLDWYPQEQRMQRKTVGIPEDAFVVGFTGSIRPVKGVDVAIRAFARLPEAMNAHLVLVGELRENHLPSLVTTLGLEGRVHFLGHRKDAVHIMPTFDVFLMPSLEREGLPRAVVEAMAQSIPVIVSSVGGLPELVEHEKSGLVIPPGKPDDLASAICALYERPDKGAELGRQARDRIADVFSVRRTIAQMKSLFENLANK